MKTSGAARLKTLLPWAFVAVGSFGLAASLAYAIGLRINTSRSLPMGLYISATDTARSNLVEFCPSGTYAEQSRERGYRIAGACPDGAAPLLKPMVAREGDVVELSDAGISVNGTLLKNTAPLKADGKGRLLTAWKFGTYRVAPGQVWVASTYHRGSYDSRYFGPIFIASIRQRLRPLWTLR
jgi:conjugative transfer signal peptidase TraF